MLNISVALVLCVHICIMAEFERAGPERSHLAFASLLRRPTPGIHPTCPIHPPSVIAAIPHTSTTRNVRRQRTRVPHGPQLSPLQRRTNRCRLQSRQSLNSSPTPYPTLTTRISSHLASTNIFRRSFAIIAAAGPFLLAVGLSQNFLSTHARYHLVVSVAFIAGSAASSITRVVLKSFASYVDRFFLFENYAATQCTCDCTRPGRLLGTSTTTDTGLWLERVANSSPCAFRFSCNGQVQPSCQKTQLTEGHHGTLLSSRCSDLH
jgi:hypothetical protein